MRRHLIVAGLVLAPVAALTCCVAYDPTQPVKLVGEQALIVWDDATKTQHFIRQASFQGKAGAFGFVVPTPSVPKVYEADARLFQRLRDHVDQELDKRRQRVTGQLTPQAAASESTAHVIEQYQVGDYLATIIQASDGDAMLAWLQENGFEHRPAMVPWFNHYTDKGWYFAALKFTRKPDSTREETSAIRITFQTDKPFYPYKMPSDTWPARHYRPMNVYFIANAKVTAKFSGSGKPWEAENEFDGPLGDYMRHEVQRLASLQGQDMPRTPVLTSFVNRGNPIGYDEDLEFEQGRPPVHQVGLYAVGPILLGIGAFAWMNRRRNAPGPPQPNSGP
ncbi:MAG: DUF2330 domain-containing protein [Fimbriimonadaceae bacterium]